MNSGVGKMFPYTAIFLFIQHYNFVLHSSFGSFGLYLIFLKDASKCTYTTVGQ